MNLRRFAKSSLLVGLGLLLSAHAADAQVFTPTFLSPVRSSDVGIYLNDGPGEFSVEGIWRGGFGGFDLGLRGGVADTGDVTALLGLDYRRPVAVGAPLGLALTGAAQVALADLEGAGFMAGLTLGPTFSSPGLSFTPYVHPRVGLVEGFFSDEWDLEMLGDVGFDLAFERLDLRFGITIDDEGADWGVGVAWD